MPMSCKKLILYVVILMVHPFLANAQNHEIDENRNHIEKYLQNVSAIEPWLKNKSHFILARSYAIEGNEEKMMHHFKKIDAVRDRRILSRPFLDLALRKANKNDINSAIYLIENHQTYENLINDVPYDRMILDPEIKTREGARLKKEYKIKENWLVDSFCLISIKTFAKIGEAENALKISNLKECKNRKHLITTDMLISASFVKHNNYVKAYEYLENNQLPFPKIFELCKNAKTQQEQNQNFKSFLIDRTKKDKEIIFTDQTYEIVKTLSILKYFDQAYAIIEKIPLNRKNIDAIIPTYEHLYLTGDYDKVLHIINKLGTYDQKPFPKISRGANLRRGRIIPLEETIIISEHITPFGILLATKLNDTRARLKTLEMIFNNATEKQYYWQFPNCIWSLRSCIMSHLENMAENETKKQDGDFMSSWHTDLIYAHLSKMALQQNQKTKAEKYLQKMTHRTQFTCVGSECNAQNKISAVTFSNKTYQFATFDSYNPELVKNLKAFDKALREYSTNYKKITEEASRSDSYTKSLKWSKYISKCPIDEL